MDIRTAVDGDLPALVELATPLQARPDRHVAYASLQADAIAAEIAALDRWAEMSSVLTGSDGLRAGLIGEIDEEIGRVWWWGPFVADDEPWAETASALLTHARAQLPATIVEEEFVVDDRFTDLIGWAETTGFVTGDGSAVLVLPADAPIEGAAGRAGSSPAPTIRLPEAADTAIIGPLHDRLFPGSHLPGPRLLERGDDRFRLVAEVDGEPVGYVAFERTADGEAYIDLLGVDPGRRRAGLGRALVLAAVDEGRRLGCHQSALTVRAGNDGARALYRSIGFTEERVIVGLRRGFPPV